MENLGYLIAAYAIIWVVTFGYILTLGARQRRLAAEVEDLQAELDRSDSGSGSGL
jgi:CcmD family protein